MHARARAARIGTRGEEARQGAGGHKEKGGQGRAGRMCLKIGASKGSGQKGPQQNRFAAVEKGARKKSKWRVLLLQTKNAGVRRVIAKCGAARAAAPPPLRGRGLGRRAKEDVKWYTRQKGGRRMLSRSPPPKAIEENLVLKSKDVAARVKRGQQIRRPMRGFAQVG
jgi:hypothetical protein